MTIHLEWFRCFRWRPVFAILLMPRLLKYIVAAYGIIAGLAGILA